MPHGEQSQPVFSFVVPILNEEDLLPLLFEELSDLVDTIDSPSEVILVDDGSTDRSFELVHRQSMIDSRFRFIRLSRNFGHQYAITAGIDNAVGDAVIVIDGDLQDPPEVVPEMIEKWRSGYQVVSGRRTNREGETKFKVLSARLFYRLLNRLAEIPIPEDVGDFRLMDRQVVDALRSLRERNRYLRGMVSWVGFSQATVDYTRRERAAGATKYTLSRMSGLGINGILQFSTVPLRLISRLGLALSVLSFVAGLAAIAFYIAGATVPGWTSIVVASSFLAGSQLIVLGIIGGYVGRIYDEVRGRPLYVVREAGTADHE